MVDQKNNNSANVEMADSSELLSDETIDELGYARFTATSNTLPVSQSTALSAMVVTGPTKSPPPVLMPRPRPAIHPTLKLTNAFAHPEPALSPTPSPSASVQDELPEQPPSTYLTPPLAPILKPVASPTTAESLSGIVATAQGDQRHIIEDIPPPPPPPQQQQQQLPFYGKSSPATPSPPPTQPVISAPSIGEDSNLNHHQISNRSGMATQHPSNQSEEQETGKDQHSSTSLTASNDSGRSHSGVLVRKPGVISLAASTSAPLVPSPLVKSTLASQLSSSSSSSSSGSEQHLQQQQDEKNVQQQKQPHLEQKEQQHRQQRRLRKSLSTDQLPKPNRNDFHPPPPPPQQQHVPFSGGTRPAGVEKVVYSSGGKSTLQQLQQEYLLRQNGYLRRQVDALKFDNMESQRQHQELATRMKQLEIQLLEEKKRQTPQQQNRAHEPPTTTNEYQHHHYYHHNIFAPLPPPPLHMDEYHSSEEDEEMDMEQRAKDDKEQHGGGNHITTKKRPGQQTYGMEDGNFVDQQRRQQSQEEEYEASVEEGRSEDKLYMARHHGFSPLITTKKVQQQQKPMNQQKRPLLDQRRHSSHIAPIPSTSDSTVSATQKQQQQRPRQRHVTAPSLPHHYRDTDGHGQQDQRGWNRQRSRSVPKNEYLQPSPISHYRQLRDDRVTPRGNPSYLDDNDNSPHHQHHHQPKGIFPAPQQRQQRFDHQELELDDTDDEDMDDNLYMERRHKIEDNEDYYYDDEDDIDYLQELDFYRYHMAAADPPTMYYPPPPEAFFNDHYPSMPPMVPPPPPPPLPLRRRKSASAMRPSRTGPQGFMDVMNPELYERPLRPGMRRNWNNPQVNQLPQMHMAPPSPRQQHQHKHRGYSGDPAPYGQRQRGHLLPPTTMSIAPPRSGATVDHNPPRKAPVMASPRMTTLPLRRPMVARGPSIGSYPGRV